MILYLYGKCSTCQQALRFLEQRKIVFVCKEITETPPLIPELQAMLGFQGGKLRKLFNSSGQLYREMHLNEKLEMMSEVEALQLLSDHGMLVKRPFFIAADFGLTGFNEAIWARNFKTDRET